MIYDLPKLPGNLQVRSQRHYLVFNFMNGLSYRCVGETVVVLAALAMKCPDYIVALLSAMIYLGYLLLPVGRFACARWGATGTQKLFWTARNLAALSIVVAAALSVAGWYRIAVALLLLGSFTFYGCRAAGLVSNMPLLGCIAEDNCGRFLQYNQLVFYIGSCISLSLVGVYLHRQPGLGPICFVMVAGALVGLLSVLVLGGVDETAALQASSRQPVLPQLRQAFHDRIFLKLLLANFCLNLTLILAVQNQVLALKRSYGVSDWTAMLFSLVMCGGGILFTYLAAAVVKYIGPRKILLISLGALLMLCLMWWFAPAQLQAWRFVLLFAIAGGCSALFDSCVAHYFLATVPQENQVICSICNYLLAGGGAGAVGLLGVGALLRHLVPVDLPDAQVLGAYQHFYAVGVGLCLLALWSVAALPPLPMELRVPPKHK